MFWERNPEEERGVLLLFFFGKDGNEGCLLMNGRGRVCGRLKREDQMAKGGPAACSMFFPQKRGGGCGGSEGGAAGGC